MWVCAAFLLGLLQEMLQFSMALRKRGQKCYLLVATTGLLHFCVAFCRFGYEKVHFCMVLCSSGPDMLHICGGFSPEASSRELNTIRIWEVRGAACGCLVAALWLACGCLEPPLGVWQNERF